VADRGRAVYPARSPARRRGTDRAMAASYRPRRRYRGRDPARAGARGGARRGQRPAARPRAAGTAMADAGAGGKPGDPGLRARADPGPVAGLWHGVKGGDGHADHLLSGDRRVLRRAAPRRSGLARPRPDHGCDPAQPAMPRTHPGGAAGPHLRAAGGHRGRPDRGDRRRVGRLERRARLSDAARQRPHASRPDVRRPVRARGVRGHALLRGRRRAAPE
jgi:hypothetical protein